MAAIKVDIKVNTPAPMSEATEKNVRLNINNLYDIMVNVQKLLEKIAKQLDKEGKP